MKNFIIVTIIFILTGCNNHSHEADQCMRQELFTQCMKNLPAGPLATRYNDWDEVVKACDNIAYYQSQRLKETIKKECL